MSDAVTRLNTEAIMRSPALIAVVLSSLTVLPDAAVGQVSVEDAVRQTILDQYEFGRENLRDSEGAYSREGSLEFWSSGGLLHEIPTDTPPAEYVFNTLTPKHITVIPIGSDVAVVHMYVEGGFHSPGQEPVPNYLTRGTLVMVLEGGAWVSRAAHWSPIRGGTGTNLTAPVIN